MMWPRSVGPILQIYVLFCNLRLVFMFEEILYNNRKYKYIRNMILKLFTCLTISYRRLSTNRSACTWDQGVFEIQVCLVMWWEQSLLPATLSKHCFLLRLVSQLKMHNIFAESCTVQNSVFSKRIARIAHKGLRTYIDRIDQI